MAETSPVVSVTTATSALNNNHHVDLNHYHNAHAASNDRDNADAGSPSRLSPSAHLASTTVCYLPEGSALNIAANSGFNHAETRDHALLPPQPPTYPRAAELSDSASLASHPEDDSAVFPSAAVADDSEAPPFPPSYGPDTFAMMPDGSDDVGVGDDDDDDIGVIEAFPRFEVDPGSAPASLCTTPTAGATTTTFGPSVGGASAMAMSASVLGAGLVPVLDDGSLLLGPYRDANDAALCADLGVGAYLCVARECEVPPHAVASGAPALHLPLVDGPSEQLAEHVPRACAWIDAQAGLGRRVAVFCRAGKSRSVSIAAAYVMHRTGMSGRAALAHVKTVHPRADPNLSFVMQIGEIGAVTPLAASSSLCR